MRLPRTIATLLGLALLPLALPTAAAALDTWVPVAVAGLGDPARKQVDGLTVLGEDVYLATKEATAGAVPRVFRAAIAEDDVWDDITPPWGGAPGEVKGLEVIADRVAVATADGQVWRLVRAGLWTPLPPPGTGGLLALGGFDPGDRRGERHCVLRVPTAVWCLQPGGVWAALPAVPVAEPASVGSGRLAGFRGELYVGLGGASAGDRGCEVWRWNGRDGWRAVTTDCFGRWDDAAGGLTFLTDMQVFDGRIYFGTGGHDVAPVLVRFDGRDLEDVTPSDLYSCDGLFGRCPVRYNALAASGGRLYVGTRTTEAPPAPTSS